LFLFSKKLDLIVVFVSGVLFCLGLMNPNVLDYGDKSIFPVVLWQVWFVLGCVLGKNSILSLETFSKNHVKWVLAGSALFIIVMWLKFGFIFKPYSVTIRDIFDIHFRKFPLNFYGFVFGFSMWLMVFLIITKYRRKIKNGVFLTQLIELFGRNSMLVFVVHVYFMLIIDVINVTLGIKEIPIIQYIFIILNFIICIFVIKITKPQECGMFNK
jgi:hypothetical protein